MLAAAAFASVTVLSACTLFSYTPTPLPSEPPNPPTDHQRLAGEAQ